MCRGIEDRCRGHQLPAEKDIAERWGNKQREKAMMIISRETKREIEGDRESDRDGQIVGEKIGRRQDL